MLNASSSVEGRRIIHVKTVGEQMYCRKCKSILSLTDITEEERIVLASIFDARCRLCGIVTGVNSDKQHKVTNQSLHFDTNAKVAFRE